MRAVRIATRVSSRNHVSFSTIRIFLGAVGIGIIFLAVYGCVKATVGVYHLVYPPHALKPEEDPDINQYLLAAGKLEWATRTVHYGQHENLWRSDELPHTVVYKDRYTKQRGLEGGHPPIVVDQTERPAPPEFVDPPERPPVEELADPRVRNPFEHKLSDAP